MVNESLEACVGDAAAQVKCHVETEFSKTFALLQNLRCSKAQLHPTMMAFVRKCESFVKKEARELHQMALKTEETRGDYIEQAYRLGMDEDELDREPGELDIHAFLDRLTTNLDELKAEEKRRLEVFSSKRAEERDLCGILHAEVEPLGELAAGQIPSLKVLEKLEAHVRKLREEKYTREQRLNALRAETVELMDHLGQPPSHFVAAVGNAEELRLTLEYIETVKTLRDDLLEVFSKRLEQRNDYEANIKIWSARLGMEEEFQVDFPANSVTEEVLTALTDMHDRVNSLKLRHLCRLVTAAREEIKALWESSLTSVEEKAAFEEQMRQEEYTEELLVAHDAEVKRLKDEAEGKKEILELLDERAVLLSTLVKCNAYDNDVNRYKNRGAELLERDKTKKETCKKLATNEGKVKTAIAVWEKRTSKSFLIGGSTFLEVVKRDADVRVGWRNGHRGCLCLEHSKDENMPPSVIYPASDRKAMKPPNSACIERLARPKTAVGAKRRADEKDLTETPTPLKVRKTMATRPVTAKH